MTDNGKPKYFSLMEQLRNDIVSGAIRPGEKLPSENELSQKYSLSRHTVRKALGILEQDGYVEAFHGKGTFCSENMRHIKKMLKMRKPLDSEARNSYNDEIENFV